MTTPKPSHTEQEYFTRVEAEKKKKISDDKRKKLTEEERRLLRATHWMHCPKCGMDLHAIPYKGVTIDKCFSCHGVYLDDGELEKIAGEGGGFLTGLLSLFKS